MNVSRQLAASLLAATALATGCTQITRDMRLGDAPGTVDQPRDGFAWSYSGGGSSMSPIGTLTFPAPLTIKLDIQRFDGDQESIDAVAMGTVEIVPGSACRLSRGARCDGSACIAEVELTQQGVCMLRLRTATPDGEAFASCWYRAQWEGDLDDHARIDRLFKLAADQAAACEGAL
jgi:hypothetical protein